MRLVLDSQVKDSMRDIVQRLEENRESKSCQISLARKITVVSHPNIKPHASHCRNLLACQKSNVICLSQASASSRSSPSKKITNWSREAFDLESPQCLQPKLLGAAGFAFLSCQCQNEGKRSPTCYQDSNQIVRVEWWSGKAVGKTLTHNLCIRARSCLSTQSQSQIKTKHCKCNEIRVTAGHVVPPVGNVEAVGGKSAECLNAFCSAFVLVDQNDQSSIGQVTLTCTWVVAPEWPGSLYRSSVQTMSDNVWAVFRLYKSWLSRLPVEASTFEFIRLICVILCLVLG